MIGEHLERKQNDGLLQYLNTLCQSGLLITQIEDEKNFNLLHHAVLKSQPGKVHFLIETAQQLN